VTYLHNICSNAVVIIVKKRNSWGDSPKNAAEALYTNELNLFVFLLSCHQL